MADLNIAAAAVRLGISKQAMRTRVRRGQVTAHKAVDGSWLVTVPDDAPDTSSPPSDVLQDASNDTPDADHDVPRWRPYDADAVIAILREQLAIKDRQISELHVMLQTAQRQLPASVPLPVESPQSRDAHLTTRRARGNVAAGRTTRT